MLNILIKLYRLPIRLELHIFLTLYRTYLLSPLITYMRSKSIGSIQILRHIRSVRKAMNILKMMNALTKFGLIQSQIIEVISILDINVMMIIIFKKLRMKLYYESDMN